MSWTSKRRLSTPSNERPRQPICRPLILDEVRRLARIESSYQTDRVLRLRRHTDGDSIGWTLLEEVLDVPYSKLYDRGNVDDWIESYSESGDVSRFRFAGAQVEGKIAGVMTWEHVPWNNTLWLVDIRVAARRRRHGIGRMLLDELKEEARRAGARGISLETQINNLPAIRFYQHEGFEIAGFNDHLYSNRDLEDQDVALFLFWVRPGAPQKRRLL